ncbi:hypothetical protein B0H15DRAFT_327887 [Mycena belliarum]|uniref:Secreted protein n=1 Tax=Mycena belliarum TaxID=1033014 RepID=A0AAD6UKU5_9AGAR|nr:hypothetical protein B0H15DRAFT_327887 [Mycena belliae]
MLFRCYLALLSLIAVASVAALPVVEPELPARDSSSNRDWRRDTRRTGTGPATSVTRCLPTLFSHMSFPSEPRCWLPHAR